MTTLRKQRLVTVATALAFAAFDLVQKATAGASFQHARSASTLVLMGVVLLVLVVLVPRVRWTPVAVGAGIAAGGALSGRIVADMRTEKETQRVTLLIGGTVKEPQVRN